MNRQIPGTLGRMYERYENDATFRSVVDALERLVTEVQLTPSEVREAAMFACIRIEERRMPLYIAEAGEIRRATDDEERRYRKEHGK